MWLWFKQWWTIVFHSSTFLKNVTRWNCLSDNLEIASQVVKLQMQGSALSAPAALSRPGARLFSCSMLALSPDPPLTFQCCMLKDRRGPGMWHHTRDPKHESEVEAITESVDSISRDDQMLHICDRLRENPACGRPCAIILREFLLPMVIANLANIVSLQLWLDKPN